MTDLLPNVRLILPRLVLLKADPQEHGKFMHSGKHALYGNPPRWHKVTADKPAPKGAPIAAHPKAAGHHEPAQHFTDEQWAALKLPDSNVNAPTYNKALEKLKAWSDAGDVTAIVGAGYGSNTYGQKLAKVANHLLGMHGSAHKVAGGQKAGTHAAVQSAPADPHPSGLPEHLAPKTTTGLQEPGALAPLAQHVMNTLDEKAAEGDAEFLSNVAKNNPEHPQIVAYAQKKLAELKAKAAPAAPPAAPSATDQLAKLGQEKAKKQADLKAAVEGLGFGVQVSKTMGLVLSGNKGGMAKTYANQTQAAAAAQKLADAGIDAAVVGMHPYFVAIKGMVPGHKPAAPSPAPAPAAAPTAPAQPAAKAPDGPLSMPAFEEGKTTVGAKAYYEKVAQKVIDHGLAGNSSVLEGMKEDGLKPNAKGKIPNTWKGKTANSKKLLALHDAALAHAKGGAKPTEADPLSVHGTTAGAVAQSADADHAAQAAFHSDMKQKHLDASAEASKSSSHAAAKAHTEAYHAHKHAQWMHENHAKTKGDIAGATSSANALTDEANKTKWKAGAPVVMAEGKKPEPGPKDGDTKPAADGGTLVLKDGHWVKQGGDPAATPATPIATPGTLSAQQLQNLQSIPWFKLKLPAENTNAKSHNAALAKIEAMAFAGDTAGLQAFIDAKAGAKQTYSKKQALTAQTALAALQQPGATAAVPVMPAPAPAAKPPAAPALDPEQKQVLDELAAGEHWVDLEDFADMHGPGTPVGDYAKKLLKDQPTPEQMDAAVAAKMPKADTADAPLTDAQKAALDDMSLQDLQALSENGQGLPPNVQAAIKAKLATSAQKTVTAPKTILHNTTPGHNKSWSVYVAPSASGGFDMVTEYGKIGGTQQKTVNNYSSATHAHSAAAALQQQKLAKGYTHHNVEYGHKVTIGAAPETGPKEGDTKMGADGMLILKDGHWVKMQKDQPSSKFGMFESLWPEAQKAIAEGDKSSLADIQSYLSAPQNAKEPGAKELSDSISKLLSSTGGAAAAASSDPAQHPIDAIPMPSMSDLKNPALVQAALELLKEKVKAEGLSALSGITKKMTATGKTITTLEHPQKLGFKFKITAYQFSGNNSSHIAIYNYVEALKAAAGKLPKKKGATKASEPHQPSQGNAAASGGMPSMDNWVKTGEQKGSNPGGKFKDPSGQEWYCKWPSDAEAAKSEVLAARLYALAGLSAQDCMLVTKGGKTAIATKWVNIKNAGSPEALAAADGALSGFAVDAWLGNWDVVGLTYDNMQIGQDGKAHRVDAGGSLEYRAQGDKKPFGAKVEEIDTLRDAQKNPKAAAVFGKMTDADITASVAKVAAITDSQIRNLVAQIGPGNTEARKKLADTLIARRADLIARYPKAVRIAKMANFKVENISKPPNFMNFVNDEHPNGGPLSSVTAINEANNAAVQAAYTAATHGNLEEIKNAVAPVFDKTTHQIIKYAPLSEHPSKHVRAYWADLVNEVDLQLNPPQMPELGTVVMDEDLNAISSMLAPVPSGASVAAIGKAQKIGDYIILGKYSGNLGVVRPPETDEAIASSAWKEKAKAMYHAASAAAKSTFSAYLSTSGARALNTALRQGSLTPDVFGKTVKQHVEDFKELLVEIPVGSTFVRRMGNKGYGSKPNPVAIKQLQQFLMSAEPGTVVQEPAFSSTSWTGGNKILGNNDIEWEFVAGKGVKMYPGWLTANSGEGEGLLPPNQRYMIIGAKKSGNTVRVKAVLLPTIA